MKTLIAIFIVLCWLLCESCKKGYTCACSSENGFYDGFDIRASKKSAEKKCTNYYKSKYETPQPQIDSLPASPVKCELLKGE
ncbi:MAG: hypothetical protein V4677_08700 [Bacteroidota bacterium]